MRYNDENQQGLMSLLAASQAGLDPTTAYGMLQDIQGNQEAQLAQRQERQSGLIGLLMESAQGGMPYGGAQAMMEAAPGPMGPALQSALGSLYGDANPTTSTRYGPVEPAGTAPMAQSLSPTYQPPPPEVPSPTEQIAVANFEQDQALQGDLTALQADAAQARAKEWTVDDYMAKVQRENPQLFAAAPEEAMAIIENTFGEQAVAMRGMPSL